jgi:hypothetical protein
MTFSICKECGNSFHYQSGCFTNHLKKEHNMSLQDYVVKYKYDNNESKIPKCQCGYCDELVPFYRGKFLEGHIYRKHQNYEWLKKQYIKKYGIPKCQCGNDITNFYRGQPRKFCNECVHKKDHWRLNSGVWKKGELCGREGMIKKYGIDSASKLPHIKKLLSKKMKKNNPMKDPVIAKKVGNTHKLRIQSGEIVPYGGEKRRNALLKSKETKSKRYKNGWFDNEKMKKSIFEKYGVEHISQLQCNREKSSSRMKQGNPMKDSTIANKQSKTFCERIVSGKINFYNTKKYKDTELYYQSSYEYDFLQLCENKKILHRISNGHFYNYLKEDKDMGFRTITDFCLDDKFEIEIKSTYIMKKQGGVERVFAKKRAIEVNNKKYVFVLDKNYSSFVKHL